MKLVVHSILELARVGSRLRFTKQHHYRHYFQSPQIRFYFPEMLKKLQENQENLMFY
jgi:hypothetical protein